MSEEVKHFLLRQGVSSSRTCPYNPRGNSQCERYNGIIWNTISLALEDQGLPIERWEEKLPEALHAIRSLLCTATNATPHERFFAFERRSVSGNTLPAWMLKPGEVLLRRFGRKSKYDPAVEVVELVDVNPNYAHVRFPGGREDTVALRNLAPLPERDESDDFQEKMESTETKEVTTDSDIPLSQDHESKSESGDSDSTVCDNEECTPQLRRSLRPSKPVDRLTYR